MNTNAIPLGVILRAQRALDQVSRASATGVTFQMMLDAADAHGRLRFYLDRITETVPVLAEKQDEHRADMRDDRDDEREAVS